MADGTLIMAPGASLPTTALTPVATLHTDGLLSVSATLTHASLSHALPGSQPTGEALEVVSASLAPAAKPSHSMNATQIIEKGRMVQGIFSGECDTAMCAKVTAQSEEGRAALAPRAFTLSARTV